MQFWFLARLKKHGAISPEACQRIRPMSAATPSLHGLPKLYKSGAPLRPILSSTGSFNHETVCFVVIRYTIPLREHSATVKNTFSFLDRISNLKVDNEVMASLDVKSLFTIIPVNFTIDIILNSIFSKEVKK